MYLCGRNNSWTSTKRKLQSFLTFAYGIKMPCSLVYWNLFSLANKKINENSINLIIVIRHTVAENGTWFWGYGPDSVSFWAHLAFSIDTRQMLSNHVPHYTAVAGCLHWFLYLCGLCNKNILSREHLQQLSWYTNKELVYKQRQLQTDWRKQIYVCQ